MTRRVLFDMDFYSSPVWEADRAGWDVPLDHLPLSRELMRDLQAWADEWTENEMAIVVREEREPDNAADMERWVRGAALCERLRTELGEGWQVGWPRYFDGALRVQWKADWPWERLRREPSSRPEDR